jgi:GR25 family glycosyltransferase involved in LPS biosynthesis
MNSIIDAIKNYKVKVINITNDEFLIKSQKVNEDTTTEDTTEEESNEETGPRINERVKKIYVINLIDDELKRNYIITLMKKLKINFTLVIVERISSELYNSLSNNSKTFISNGELGCCLSHLWCLSQIIIKGYENAIIFEDDIILHKNFESEFINIHNACTTNNNNLDFMLLGAHDFNFSKNNYKYVKNKLYRPDESANNLLYGAHANYYSLKGAKAMFKIRTTEISFFDKEYILLLNHFNNSSFICYPNLVVSNVSSSTLNHKREILTQMESEYYNKCFIKFNFNNYNFIYVNLLDKSLFKNDEIKFDEIKNDYESFIDNCLYHKFYDLSKINMVKKRFVMNFFDLNDMKMILHR